MREGLVLDKTDRQTDGDDDDAPPVLFWVHPFHPPTSRCHGRDTFIFLIISIKRKTDLESWTDE
jgi:hypothetical protein